jgi:hypothetical protein
LSSSGVRGMASHKDAIAEIKRQLSLIPDEQEVLSKIHEFEDKCRKEALDATALKSIVLISVGLLEYGLEVAIESFFAIDPKLKAKIFSERGGILGSIYARIIMGRALDIYGDKTMDDLHAIRSFRNLCAHAKHDIDLSADKLKSVGSFHSVTLIHETLGATPKVSAPTSPVQGILAFLIHFMPYLLLHSSKNWPAQNRNDWRARLSFPNPFHSSANRLVLSVEFEFETMESRQIFE